MICTYKLSFINVISSAHFRRLVIDQTVRLLDRKGLHADGAKARDGNGPREVAMWHHGENV